MYNMVPKYQICRERNHLITLRLEYQNETIVKCFSEHCTPPYYSEDSLCSQLLSTYHVPRRALELGTGPQTRKRESWLSRTMEKSQVGIVAGTGEWKDAAAGPPKPEQGFPSDPTDKKGIFLYYVSDPLGGDMHDTVSLYPMPFYRS